MKTFRAAIVETTEQNTLSQEGWCNISIPLELQKGHQKWEPTDEFILHMQRTIMIPGTSNYVGRFSYDPITKEFLPSLISVTHHTTIDRFGSVPVEVQNLLEITRLRLLGQEKKLKRIIIKDSTLQIFFDETWVQAFPTPGHISEYLRSTIQSSPVPVRFIHGKEFGLRVSIPQEEPFSFTKKLLQSWV